MPLKSTLPLEKENIWHVSKFRGHYRTIWYVFSELRHYVFQKSQNKTWIALGSTAICHRDSLQKFMIREDLFFILYLNHLLFWKYKSYVSFLPSVQVAAINLSLLWFWTKGMHLLQVHLNNSLHVYLRKTLIDAV